MVFQFRTKARPFKVFARAGPGRLRFNVIYGKLVDFILTKTEKKHFLAVNCSRRCSQLINEIDW